MKVYGITAPSGWIQEAAGEDTFPTLMVLTRNVLASPAPLSALCRHHKGKAVQQKQAHKEEGSSVGHGSHS